MNNKAQRPEASNQVPQLSHVLITRIMSWDVNDYITYDAKEVCRCRRDGS